MKLIELTRRLPGGFTIYGDKNTKISGLCTDSRSVCKGGLYFCIVGMHSDAHDFAPQMQQNGAAALVVERRLDVDLPQICVHNVREAMSYIAAAYYGFPSDRLRLIGITGTKGKTTTSFMLKSILEAAGYKTGLIGTVCTLIGDTELEAGKTTPDPVEFQKILSQMVDAGVEYAVMEVSAHALDMHRIDGVRFACAGFTNLSQDHLDYFGSMDKYLEAKLLISSMTDSISVNVDDERVAKAFEARGIPFIRVGIREKASLYAKQIDMTESGADFTLTFHNRASCRVSLKMSGLFNVYNALMASSLADSAGIPLEYIKAGLERITRVPGRVELLQTHTPYRVILDYAHSPDALENILTTLRQSTKKRLICVFGCGGGRDKGKRPIMGEISGRLADLSVVTSDNPRDEEPLEIIREIETGIKAVTDRYIIIENRREAIKYALETASSGDTVVLAGKGHETYQEIKGVKHPFDEKIVVRELLEEI